MRLPVPAAGLTAAWVGLALAHPGAAHAAPDAEPSSLEATLEAAASDPDPSDYAEQAPLDVGTILSDTSKAYLQARARLVAHPTEATEAILDRLAAVPAPTRHERKRLFDVLAEAGGGGHIELFSRELRRDVARADSPSDELEAAQRWSVLLTDQGPASQGELSGLVADKDLPLHVRSELLDDLVAITPPDRLPQLVVLVGRGARSLGSQLTRSLHRRVEEAESTRDLVLAAADTALAAPDADTRRPALLVFRAALSRDDDTEFTGRLRAMATDTDESFGVRVSAVRGLARQSEGSTQARGALLDVARVALEPGEARSQAQEILAWLSMQALPGSEARSLATEHRLHESGAPRLAAIGWSLVPLAADQTWLGGSQQNPWPRVRQAALARVEGPCPKDTLALLGQRARPKGKQGDPDPAAARGAVQALGRCGPDALGPLEKLMREGEADIEQRTEAARQLAKHGGAQGADAVARLLDQNPPRRFQRRLATTLRHVPEPTERMLDALCNALDQEPEVKRAALATLIGLRSDPEETCGE